MVAQDLDQVQTDVTAEDALRRCMATSGVALWRYDMQTRTLHDLGGMHRLVDVSEGGASAVDSVLANCDPLVVASLRNVYRIAVAKPGKEVETEIRVASPGKPVRWFSIRAMGHAAGMSGTMVDVSDRRSERDALDRSVAVIDSMRDAIVSVDHAGSVVEWNAAAESLFGYSRGDAIGRELISLAVPEQSRSKYRKALFKMLSDGIPLADTRPIEVDALRSDGSILPVEIAASVSGGEGNTRLTVHFRDLREIREASRNVEDSEERLRRLADFNPTLVWVGDGDGMLSYVNKSWTEFSGAGLDRTLAEGRGSFVHPDDRQEYEGDHERAILCGSPYTMECRLRRFDGKYFWHLLQVVPITNRDGHITGWLGSDTDIHDIVLNRDRIALSHDVIERENRELAAGMEQRTRDHDRLWQISQELLLVCTLEGVLLAVNPSCRRMSGFEDEQILGTSCVQYVHPDDLDEVASNLQRLAGGDSGIGLAFRSRFRCADGSYRVLDLTAVKDDDLVHVVGRDITDQHAAEQRLAEAEDALRQAQKMEAVGQLTGGIAHDFNNLLTGIIGGIDIAKRKLASGNTGDIDRFMDAAMTSANRAATLTQRLLAFGRRQTLDIRAVDLSSSIVSLEDLLKRTLGENVRVDIDSCTPDLHAKTDLNQFENAILNLAINARDAMPDGGVLTVACRTVTMGKREAAIRGVAEGSYAVVDVGDTGTGMSAEVLERVFEPFYTTKPIGQGTGLGLSMIYGFAKQSEGTVEIESTPGAGTTVSIYLPLAVEAEAELPEVVTEMPSGEGETVLVVEDDVGVRLLVLEVLQDLGYEALEAEDGFKALDIVATGVKIDMLVSDVGLPGMDGREVARRVREMRPGLPVLFVTGYAEGAARDGFLDEGMELLTKPFSLDGLATAIRSVIERKKPAAS